MAARWHRHKHGTSTGVARAHARHGTGIGMAWWHGLGQLAWPWIGMARGVPDETARLAHPRVRARDSSEKGEKEEGPAPERLMPGRASQHSEGGAGIERGEVGWHGHGIGHGCKKSCRSKDWPSGACRQDGHHQSRRSRAEPWRQRRVGWRAFGHEELLSEEHKGRVLAGVIIGLPEMEKKAAVRAAVHGGARGSVARDGEERRWWRWICRRKRTVVVARGMEDRNAGDDGGRMADGLELAGSEEMG